MVTKETWTDIIEKSHAPRHIFYKAGKWAGEVTKVSLVRRSLVLYLDSVILHLKHSFYTLNIHFTP